MITLIVWLALTQSVSPVTTIVRTAMSGVDRTEQVVVQTEDEWRTLWKSHAPLKTLPVIDVAQATILAVFMGSRPTGGYTIGIRQVRDEGGVIVVEYAESEPGPGTVAAQVLTSPCHIVSIPKHAGPFRFERVAAPTERDY